MEITRLSSKGQIILPKSIRESHRWRSGLRFAVEDMDDGIVLRPLKSFKPTKLSEVVGCAGYTGPRKSLADMDKAIAAGAKRHR